MTTKTILLVEDNPQDEMVTLRARRKASGVNRVDGARDGRQALDYIKHDRRSASRGRDFAGDAPTAEAALPGYQRFS